MASTATATSQVADRSGEAERVVQFLLKDGWRLAVIYGRHGSRRRELIQEWVMPKLTGRKDALYCECNPGLPRTATGPAGETSLEEALQRGAMVFLGHVERCLELSDGEEQRSLAELLMQVQAGALKGSLVLSISDRSLSQILSLPDVATTLIANMIEIRVVTFRDSLQQLSGAEGGSGLEYTPEAVESLATEAERNGVVDGFELARAVDWGFSRFKADMDRQVTERNCERIGGVAGSLKEYRKLRLDEAGERWGEEGANAADLILAEVATACKQDWTVQLSDLAMRLGTGQAVFSDVFGWMCGDAQLLRGDGMGRFKVMPAELRNAVEEETASKQREAVRASGLLREGVKSYSALGATLPRKRLEEIKEVREWVPASDDEAALMVRSLLRADKDEDVSSIPYWLQRIRSTSTQSSVLMEALFADAATVRVRGAELLAGYDEPDVRRQLHRIATSDPEREVRLAALASLGRMQVEELWPILSQEARDPASPYQINAVAALRLFREERAIAVLRDLVASPDQRPEVKAEAIETIARIGTSDAVQLLVEIGLNDENIEDRQGAAAALASIDDRDRAREAVDAVGKLNVTLGSDPVTFRRGLGLLARGIVSILIVFANLIVHGAALMALRRFRSGFAFLGAGILFLIWGGMDPRGTGVIAYGLFWINALASVLVATRVSMRENEEAAEKWLAARQRTDRASAWKLGQPLTVALLIADLPLLIFFHGLAQALFGRPREALKLFGLECVGIVCFGIGMFCFSGEYTSVSAFSPLISKPLLWLYVIAFLTLFCGTFLWDVIPVIYILLLRPRLQYGWYRQAPIYSKLAENRWATEYLLECAASPIEEKSRWARRVVKRTAQVMAPSQIISALRASPENAGCLVKVLERMKTPGTVALLGEEWRNANRPWRRRIVKVLADRPDEQSLEQMASIRRDMSAYERLRYELARWHYRFRLWPTSVLLLSALLFPLPILATVEFAAIVRNPARPVLRMVQVPYTRHQMAAEGTLVEALQFLAKMDTSTSPEELTDLFHRSAAEYRNSLPPQSSLETVGHAVCSLPGSGLARDQQRKVNALREELVSVLADAVRSDQTQAIKAVSILEESSDRCEITAASSAELTKAALALEPHVKTPKDEELVIAALGASGDEPAVGELRYIAIKYGKRRGFQLTKTAAGPATEQREWNELAYKALLALNGNFSDRANTVLAQIADAQDIPDLAKNAKELVRDREKSVIATVLKDAREKLDAADYKGAYDTASPLLRETQQGEQSEDVLDVLGEATYWLAMGSTPDAKNWTDKAITYLAQKKKVAGDSDPNTRRKISNVYGVRAQYLRRDNKFPAAFADAERSIAEDPTSGFGYRALAWLWQEDGHADRSLPYVLTAIEKEPDESWGYSLLRTAYMNQVVNANQKQQISEEAIQKFEGLEQQHPKVMWPKSELALLYHDTESAFNPAAFEKAYELERELDQQFAKGLAVDQRLDLEANFLESRFTVGRYPEVLSQSAELEKQLPDGNYELRIPVALYKYAALAMLGEAKAAEAQLTALQKLISKLPKDYELTWGYDGSLTYLRRSKAPSDMQEQLIDLIEAMNSLQKTRSLPPEVIAANRKALHADRLVASLP